MDPENRFLGHLRRYFLEAVNKANFCKLRPPQSIAHKPYVEFNKGIKYAVK